METFSKDLITLLQYLLPGFMAAWVFYGFTSCPKPSQFERVIQALIFTIIIQVFVFVIKKIFSLFFINEVFLSENINLLLILSILLALLVGIIFSYCVNNDIIHKVLRDLKIRDLAITKETSYPSEWFGVFQNNITYVVLHFEDDRRLYGWPIEWPSEPRTGHFVLVEASWLDSDGEKEIPISGVKSIMVDAKDVKWVEFMEENGENKNG